MLLLDGLKRGGWTGMAEDTAGGAMIGFKFGGPLGAAIGAAAGAVAGIVRMFIKGAADKAKEKIKALYGVDISDKGVLQQIVDTAKSGFGGNIDMAIRSPQVRDLIQLYAMTTGQKISGMPGSVTPLSLVETGGSLFQSPQYNNGTPLPALGGLSTILGVRVLRILKITGKEPTYQVELETTKIELPNVSKLVDQRSFRMAIASAADRLIPKIKPKVWEQLAQAMLDALTIEDGGEETDFVGSVRIHLENYLSETPFIDSIEEQPIQTRRKPTIIDGKIAICSSDFQSHINKTNNENHSVKAVASMLAALGATSTRIRNARLRDQSRWLLPVTEFAADDFAGTDKDATDAQPS